MRSLDWRVMMRQGERYELRQSVGIGFGNFTLGDYGEVDCKDRMPGLGESMVLNNRREGG